MSETVTHRLAFDSERQQLGDVYAKALVAALENQGRTDEVLGQFDSLIADVLDSQPQLEAILASPRVPHAEKVELLDKAFAGRMDGLLLNFLKVVSRHQRLDCLRVIHRRVRKLVNELRGRKEVIVETAVPLDDQLRGQVIDRLKDLLRADVILDERVSPDLLGGIRVRVGDTVYDGSVLTRLRQLRGQVSEIAGQRFRDSMGKFVGI